MSTRVCVPPRAYLHVEEGPTCDVLTLVGPLVKTYKAGSVTVLSESRPLVVVPPNHYVEVKNPVHLVRDASADEPAFRLLRTNPALPHQLEEVRYSRWKCRYGSSELRFASDSPFPLLPGEEAGEILPMPLLRSSQALRLQAVTAHDAIDTQTGQLRHREAHEVYLYRGPGLYTPQLCERVLGTEDGKYVKSTDVCFFAALKDLVDDDGVPRAAGSQWTAQFEGIVFCHPAATLKVEEAWVVPNDFALMACTTAPFFDERLQVQRLANVPYMLHRADTVDGVYVQRWGERVVRLVPRVTMTATQYCVVANPGSADGAAAGAARRREAVVKRGQQSFFPLPGERVTPVLDVLVLEEGEALLVTAVQSYVEEDPRGEESARLRDGGARWLVHGPGQYIPPIYAKVLERRRVIRLDENEGVYVRNIYSGAVRSVFGRPFMLQADEVLWPRPLSAYVRRLLAQPRQSLRVEEMSPEEMAAAAVEEGRTNALRGFPSTTGAAFATRAGADDDDEDQDDSDHEEEEDEEEEEEEAGSDYTDDADEGAGQSSNDTDMQQKALLPPAPSPYGATVNLLRLAVRNASPQQQPSDLSKYRVVTANAEHNTLMRVYDTSTGCSRVVAGPATVYLEPHEHFTSLSLSGGRPKQPHRIHTLSLYLGPDYMADTIDVETRDHARLRLHLAYNWEFDGAEPSSATGVNAQLAFTIPDFVGEACKALASRVRSVIAGTTFEYFHCNSSTLIRQAIFASAADGSAEMKKDALHFTANGLRITTVDVQSVEPVDVKTRTALTKSVQLAVEIITTAQESEASHQAALLEQEASGALELHVMRDRAKAEEQRTALLRVVSDNTVLEQAGASRAQAQAEAEARMAEAQGEVEATPLRCAAHAIGMDAELEVLRRRAEMDLAHRAAMNALEVERVRRLADVEASKYERIMAALGQDTLVALANAGPEVKAQLLEALGLEGFVVTDGSAPINMLNFADQMASRPAAA